MALPSGITTGINPSIRASRSCMKYSHVLCANEPTKQCDGATESPKYFLQMGSSNTSVQSGAPKASPDNACWVHTGQEKQPIPAVFESGLPNNANTKPGSMLSHRSRRCFGDIMGSLSVTNWESSSAKRTSDERKSS